MKDHQGECFGKISHPYRVWKVYKQRFSENTLIFSHMENLNPSPVIKKTGQKMAIFHLPAEKHSYLGN